MGVSEVTHMRVVAGAGADRRGIVIREYHDRMPPHRREQDQGKEARFRLVELAELTTGTGASRVNSAARRAGSRMWPPRS
jgi:hypothetical protein